MSELLPCPELKNCPFCGKDACLYEFEHGPASQGLPDKEGQPFFRASCENSSCHAQPTAGFHDLKAEAIAAWNTRPAPGEREKRLEDLVQWGQKIVHASHGQPFEVCDWPYCVQARCLSALEDAR